MPSFFGNIPFSLLYSLTFTYFNIRVEIICLSITDSSRQILLTTTETTQNFDNRNVYKNDNYDKNIVHLGYAPTTIEGDLCEQNIENIQNVYTNLSVPKKRKLSQDSPLVKSEPGIIDVCKFSFNLHVKIFVEHCSTGQLSPSDQLNTSVDEDYASSEACLSESQYQCIRFSAFQQTSWHVLCDQNLTEL